MENKGDHLVPKYLPDLNILQVESQEELISLVFLMALTQFRFQETGTC